MTAVETAPADTGGPCGADCDGKLHIDPDTGLASDCPVQVEMALARARSTPAAAKTRPYNATTLDSVREQPVAWLWPGRLPVGKLVVLDGDPGVGKSTLMLDVAARLTTGQPMPGQKRPTTGPRDVVLLAHEDGLGDTIRPRVVAAGADVSRVHHLDSVPVYDSDGRLVGTRPPVIPDDMTPLEQLVTDTGAALVVVDVLTAYMSSRVNMYKDQDVRAALHPLAEMANRTGCTAVLVRHPTKSQRGGGDAIAAGGGSIGIIGIARVGLLAAVDPDDAEGERRLLAVAKCNLGQRPPTLAFAITGAGGDRSRVAWCGSTQHTANDLLRQLDPEERSALDELREWIPAVLGYAEGHAMENRELQPLVLEQGWSRGQLYRVRRRLQDDGIVTIEANTDVRGCPVTWRLTATAEDAGEMDREP